MQRKSVYFLIVAVAILVAIGSVMLFSTSAFVKEVNKLGPHYFLKRQIIWLAVGFVLSIVAANLDYHFWQRTWWIWFAASVFLLTLCYIPPFGHRLNGSARWLKLGFAQFQPSEFAKLASVVGLAWWYARPETRARHLLDGFVYPIAGTAVLLALIVFEVDMGTTALIGATMFTIMFVAGTRLTFLAGVATLGVSGLVFGVLRMPERMGRVMAFLYPDKYPADFYQQLQGLIALGSGGVEGLGLGNGRQKMAYLPYANTDFIFPIIGEELGLRCTLLIVFCYLVIIVCGTIIAMQARDRFGALLAFGLVVLIALQAAVNIGVTTAVLPNKGLTLPFISYGGSNLVFCTLCVGILVNIYRQGVSEKGDKSSVRLRVMARPRKRAARIKEQ
jgi:cell division protein FtsW